MVFVRHGLVRELRLDDRTRRVIASVQFALGWPRTVDRGDRYRIHHELGRFVVRNHVTVGDLTFDDVSFEVIVVGVRVGRGHV